MSEWVPQNQAAWKKAQKEDWPKPEIISEGPLIYRVATGPWTNLSEGLTALTLTTCNVFVAAVLEADRLPPLLQTFLVSCSDDGRFMTFTPDDTVKVVTPAEDNAAALVIAPESTRTSMNGAQRQRKARLKKKLKNC